MGDGGVSPISNMLRTGDRGVLKGEGERSANMVGAAGRAWLPSRSASTSLRSSSNMASIDMGCCGGRDILGYGGCGLRAARDSSTRSM